MDGWETRRKRIPGEECVTVHPHCEGYRWWLLVARDEAQLVESLASYKVIYNQGSL